MSLAGSGASAAQKIAGSASSMATGITIDAKTGSLSIGVSSGTGGINNTHIGNLAAADSTAGDYNSTLGYGAAKAVASDYNMVTGASAGASCSTGGPNTVVGALADVAGGSDTSSVVLGYGARSRGPGAVVIGASAVGGAGAGAINIANRITASNGDAGYALTLGGDHVRLAPSVRVIVEAPLVVSARDAGRTPWWRIGTAQGAGGAWNLEFRSRNNTLVAFDDEFAPGVLNFTGSHRCAAAYEATGEEHADGGGPIRAGCVLVATGKYRNLDGSEAPGVDEAVPVVDVSRAEEDPRVFGVLAAIEGGGKRRVFGLGHLRFRVPRARGDGGRRLVVNSVGEGGVLV